MTRHRLGMAGLGCAAAALAAWLLWRTNEPPPMRFTSEAAQSPSRSVSAAEKDSGEAAVGDSDADGSRREAVPAPETDTPATPAMLHVRLRGVVPAVPWTAPIALRWKGDSNGERRDHEARAEVATDGTCVFPLPEFVATATTRRWQFDARDPNYQPLQELTEHDLDLDDELVLDVQAVAVLTGRVVDARGEPVPAAKLTAFAMRDGKPAAPPLGTTNTFAEGTYRLRVPPETDLFVVAVAMEEAKLSGLRMHTENGIATLDTARPQLQPATCRATATLGSPRDLPDLVLADSPTITGIVQWSDRTPIAHAVLFELPAGSDDPGLPIGENCGVRRNQEGRLVLGSGATSDADGNFTLPWLPGGTHRLMLARLKGAELLADVVTPAFPPPARTVVTVPLPTIVRALRAGKPVPRATIAVTGFGSNRTDEQGELRIVAGIETEVTASHGPARSDATPIGPGQSGQTVDLVLTDALTRVAIEFTGDIRVRNASFHWRRDDGDEGRDFGQRDDRGDPFELFLAPGHYTLHVGPGPGERNGLYLLPIDREIDVGTVELRLDLPAVFGGTFTVQVTDSAGRPVAGTCRVHTATGDDVTAPFANEHGEFHEPGAFADDGPAKHTRLLPPGTYELELTFAEFGVQRTQVTIRARETAEVRLRLP